MTNVTARGYVLLSVVVAVASILIVMVAVSRDGFSPWDLQGFAFGAIGVGSLLLASRRNRG